MTDELCAREGCGAPKAWHSYLSTVADLIRHAPPWRQADTQMISLNRSEGVCLEPTCACPGYLPPEPPNPERKAYVVEMTDGEVAYRGSLGLSVYSSSAAGTRPRVTAFIPLADYLAAHPQPIPDPQPTHTLCICGGREDEHDPVTGRCSHVAKRARRSVVSDERSTFIETLACMCPKFEVQP